jgi:hypothetical protein
VKHGYFRGGGANIMTLKMRYIFAVLALAVLFMVTNLWSARRRLFGAGGLAGAAGLLLGRVVDGTRLFFSRGASSLMRIMGAVEQWKSTRFKVAE